MAEIAFTGNDVNTTFRSVDFNKMLEWLLNLNIVALDTETNVVDSILERELKVISIADEHGKQIWVIQWNYLTIAQQKVLLHTLQFKLCIIQNVSFDYTVIKKYGYTLEKVYDTMLAEQVLTTGLASEKGFHGLQAIYSRRFDLDISKNEQLTFGDTDTYSDNQIEYAAVDVLKLGTLRRLQLAEMFHKDKRMNQPNHKGERKTLWWENEFVKGVGDMETTGIRLDKKKWYNIEDSVRPTYDEELKTLNSIVKTDFYDILEDNEWISGEDTFTKSIWSSAMKKKVILAEIYDFEIEKTDKVSLKKYLEQHDPDFPEGLKLSGKAWNSSDYPTTLNSIYAILKLLILNSKDWSAEKDLDAFLLTNMRQFCIEKEWLRPAGQLSLNWASPVQRLKIFKAIDPTIESTGKDVIVEYAHMHSLITHYLIWGEVEYQLKNFGKKFYDQHVELDGKHRTRYNQILSTGRLSSVKPNILNIPRKIQVYREAVIPDKGYKFINADFDGQELVIVASLSQEPSWIEALEKGWDLHSRNADLIFGKDWKNARIPNCKYYEYEDGLTNYRYDKCNCPRHKEMRDASKAISFGMLYGITEFSLSPRLNITVEKAKELMDKFFEKLPGIKIMMESFGDFAIENGYIIEPVFGRVRYFDKWKLSKSEEIGGVRRQAYNFPKLNGKVKHRELLENPLLKDVQRMISSRAA